MRVAVIVLSLASTVCLVSLAFWQLADSEDLKPEPISEERIIVMQHFNTNDDRVHRLQNISRIQHEQYASFWGYGYHVSEQQFVPSIKPVRERQMNKLYALLALAIEQVGRGEYGAEWIYITDADVLIRNPAIPLHALLPMDPAALIVGTEDFNGFNSGNMLYRCGRDLIAFLSHAIALSYQIAREYDVAQDVGGGELFDIETPPSDQRALCLTLEQQSSFADRFFHYPSHWLNAYLPDLRDMQLNSHLVADDRYRADLDQFLISEREGWGRLEEMSTAEIIVTVESVKSQAEDYWKDAKTGLPHCIWV